MKSKDDIYKAFLDEIDEDLRSMCEMNGKVERSLPCPYCGEKNVEPWLNRSLTCWKSARPIFPGWCPSSIEPMYTRPVNF